MTIQELFKSTPIEEVEEEIINLQYQIEHRYGNYESQKDLIKRLLGIRKRLLNHEFVMNEHHKQLLEEFNAAMREQLKKTRIETIKTYLAVIRSGINGKIKAVGKCFMGYEYSNIHPIQTIRSKKIWEILSGILDNYDPLYEDGVISNGWQYLGGEPETENMMLYLSEKMDNWNEGLDSNLTKDMNIIHAVHNLYDHTAFSIFDLLWVRDFNMEIHVEIDYCTYKTDDNNDINSKI